MTPEHLKQLDDFYHHVNSVILSRQHPVTGLFPASTSINSHGNYTDAWVRDNVYSIQAVWALYLANKRASDPHKRAHELEYACIKMMRGLLFAMMRQAHKVERFKHTLNPLDALHAKYDTKTGLETVADDAWGHLQVDATSFYLLMLAQMTKAGSVVIYTQDELNFIQNLIYYISRTYRTPDYGIWERGNKVNNGKAEINASSVGMAKAAMEALDGLNLFGEQGPDWAVIHSFPDAVARAGSVLESLLPKESRSKEVDSALLSILSILSFPAFAVNDEQLKRRTRKEIMDKLAGNYGCKRFLLDGHQTVLEDPSRIYYEYDELINFEHIESEWPLFFTYLYIDRLFAGDWERANFYRYRLEELMVEKDGQRLLPELYYVPQESILAEKENPGSQKRVPNDNLPLVWAQSLYIVGRLLDEELITKHDLDPLGLHRIQHNRRRMNISLVVLTKNEQIKEQLIANGCLCQTIDEIAPIKVISSEQLIDVYRHLGTSSALGLSGRPSRALYTLGTSQTYLINNERHLCLAWFQNENKDYRKADPKLFERHILNELHILSDNWYYPANGVFTVLIDEVIASMPGVDDLYQFIRRLQQGEFGDLRILPQSAKNAFKSGNRRSMRLNTPDYSAISPKLPVYETPWPLTEAAGDDKSFNAHELDSNSLLARLTDHPTLSQAIDILLVLAQRGALSLPLPNTTPHCTANTVLESIYVRTIIEQRWRDARRLYALLLTPSTDLATYIADITVRQRTLVIGDCSANEFSISSPLDKEDIFQLLQQSTNSGLALVLYHELIAVVGTLIKDSPDYFSGVRTIRLHNLAQLCCYQLMPNKEKATIEDLATCSPSELYRALENVLTTQHHEYAHITTSMSVDRHIHLQTGKLDDVDWFEWRETQGLITKLPDNMLLPLWDCLSQAQRIVFGDSQSNTTLDCSRTLKSMTPGEDTFALLIEQLTADIHPSWFKSLIFEGLFAFIQFCQQHKGKVVLEEVNLPVLVSKAAADHVQQRKIVEVEGAALDEFAQLPPSRTNYYLKWAVSKLHSQQRH
ncbi:phosphorylase kinase [Maribrevibacterium harenarium]|uniref:Phosphorylase kinase n=1 Tax=Maribrevibacterium harenarium TaxID=2589817 RepID=A0A501X213_9GAMM|nr:glycoside hydrolase family 15 protein [Maribrevibacterium harenarium]TPE54512.1 phosphorylase kinase [Maribrevibacterium harenarium]